MMTRSGLLVASSIVRPMIMAAKQIRMCDLTAISVR